MLVELYRPWLRRQVSIESGAKRPRHELAGFAELPDEEIIYLPVRSVRVLYALPNDDRRRPAESRLFDRLKGRLALEAHEYLIRHSGLAPTNPQTRALVRAALGSHVA